MLSWIEGQIIVLNWDVFPLMKCQRNLKAGKCVAFDTAFFFKKVNLCYSGRFVILRNCNYKWHQIKMICNEENHTEYQLSH